MQESTYEILLQPPLFQGLGRNELTEIVSKVKMDFRKSEHGKTIIEEDSPCTFLAFLIRGELTVEHTTSNHTLTFSEHMAAPSAIGTENLFGLSQHHTRTYKARSDVQMLFINRIRFQFVFDLQFVQNTGCVCFFNFFQLKYLPRLYIVNQIFEKRKCLCYN